MCIFNEGAHPGETRSGKPETRERERKRGVAIYTVLVSIKMKRITKSPLLILPFFLMKTKRKNKLLGSPHPLRFLRLHVEREKLREYIYIYIFFFCFHPTWAVPILSARSVPDGSRWLGVSLLKKKKYFEGPGGFHYSAT
jgi:hypothetical protein